MQINSEPTRRQLMDQVKQQADEIERLRDALQRIIVFYDSLQIVEDQEGDYDLLVWIARAALKEGE